MADQGYWLSVDGIDGAGKTTIASMLAIRLRAEVSDEFSRGAVGDALRSSVRQRPNYIARSRLGQSLVFLGDYFEVYETQIRPVIEAGSVVVSDRGWLSKYAFQFVTLSDDLGETSAVEVLNATLGQLPRPDLTVFLDAPLDVVQQRITSRDGACGPDRLLFNSRAADAAHTAINGLVPALRRVVLDATMEPPDIVHLALAAYRASRGP